MKEFLYKTYGFKNLVCLLFKIISQVKIQENNRINTGPGIVKIRICSCYRFNLIQGP